jgi:hypothetical protein
MDWLDIIESTIPKNQKILKNKFIYKNNYNSSNNQDEKKIEIDYEKIIENNMEKNSDIEILDVLTIISKFVKNKIINNNDTKLENYNNYFLWIQNCLKILALRNKQNIEDFDIDKKKLFRNSYKFCIYSHNCKYAYSIKHKCYSQHFVYNLIYQDITRIIEYINHNKTNNDIDFKSIQISINTITFVITHIYEEILSIKNKNPRYYQLYLGRRL